MGKLYSNSMLVFIAFVLLLGFDAVSVQGRGTHVGFYSTTCPQTESIVRATVQSHFRLNPSVAPGLLRLHFHDCFVQGCDASVLLVGPNTERMAPPNLSLIGFEVINDAKSRLEHICPGVVSCADILALAARDSVVLTRGISWAVPTGRRDGRISLAWEAKHALPGFNDTIETQKNLFKAKGLNIQDLVTLVGAHTIGTTTCQFFKYRLYNFSTTGSGVDPTIRLSFINHLRTLCPENGDGSGSSVGLDINSPNKFDTSFFSNLRYGRGILESDQMLWTHPSTRAFVRRFIGFGGTSGLSFGVEFGKSMVKMSNIGVKSGSAGEIRKICSLVN